MADVEHVDGKDRKSTPQHPANCRAPTAADLIRRWIVLGEREQDTLLEMERRLAADDPDFERSFKALDAVAPARPAGRPRVSSVVIALALGLAACMLSVGAPTGALPYAVIAVLVWVSRDLPGTDAREKRRR